MKISFATIQRASIFRVSEICGVQNIMFTTKTMQEKSER